MSRGFLKIFKKLSGLDNLILQCYNNYDCAFETESAFFLIGAGNKFVIRGQQVNVIAFLSQFFVFEKTKHTKRLFIARAVIYSLFILLFFTNTDLYIYTTAEGETKLQILRIVAIIPFSLFFTFIPLIKLKLPQRAVYTVECLTIIGALFSSLWAGEHVFGYRFQSIAITNIVFNLMIIFSFFTVFYLITNRMKIGLLCAYLLTITFAIVNYYVNKFRGEAINAADLFTVGTALNVAGNYSFKITWEIYEVLYCGAVMFSGLTFFPVEKLRVKGWKRLFYIIPGTVMVIFVFTMLITSKYPLQQGVKVRTFRPMKTYKRNGQLLNFVRGFYYMRVSPPDDYSQDNLRAIIDESGYVSDSADYDDGKQNPNIIFIMNEAFSDFTIFDKVKLSDDPLKFIHSLDGKSNAIVGRVDVDVFGGRTANSEYEAITGNSAAFYPPNAVAYALYVRSKMPSMTWNMIDMGYSGNMAFHPYKANGYSRPRAYPNLGFTDFISIETIENELQPEDYLRKYVSDSADYKQVIKMYEEAKKESDAPFYLFNVTMQNHSSYDKDYANFEQDIEVKGQLASDRDFKRFVNLTDYSDEAFEELTKYFENVDEPTIIVMFGDHMPSLSTETYNYLFGKSTNAMDSYELFEKYRTPFVIWANYKINKKGKLSDRYRNMSVNYLSAVVMDVAGVPMTAYQKFLVDMQREIPSFTLHGYIDKNGLFYELDDEDSPYYNDWVLRYQYFQYNNQFDKGKREESFFRLKTE